MSLSHFLRKHFRPGGADNPNFEFYKTGTVSSNAAGGAATLLTHGKDLKRKS